MKLGIVLPSYMYSEERKRLAADAFISMRETEPLAERTRLLLLVRHGHSVEYSEVVDSLSENFNVMLKEDKGLNGTEQTLAFGTEMLFSFGVEYVTWMGDDALFHPLWLWKLEALIGRHPGAKSWSVYRSAYEWVHKTLQETEQDVLVRSICGHGLTITKREWKEWGVDWVTAWGVEQRGTTLDLVHAGARPGARWVTKESYIQHTGKIGVHCTELTPEFARDFVGAEVRS